MSKFSISRWELVALVGADVSYSTRPGVGSTSLQSQSLNTLSSDQGKPRGCLSKQRGLEEGLLSVYICLERNYKPEEDS